MTGFCSVGFGCACSVDDDCGAWNDLNENVVTSPNGSSGLICEKYFCSSFSVRVRVRLGLGLVLGIVFAMALGLEGYINRTPPYLACVPGFTAPTLTPCTCIPATHHTLLPLTPHHSPTSLACHGSLHRSRS